MSKLHFIFCAVLYYNIKLFLHF